MYLNFKMIFFGDTWSRACKTRSESRETNNPPYVENNYRIEVNITFMLIAYLVLLCEFFESFRFFTFVDLTSLRTLIEGLNGVNR